MLSDPTFTVERDGQTVTVSIEGGAWFTYRGVPDGDRWVVLVRYVSPFDGSERWRSVGLPSAHLSAVRVAKQIINGTYRGWGRNRSGEIGWNLVRVVALDPTVNP